MDEIAEVFAKRAEVQGTEWDGRCSCTDCYWNMYHPTKRAKSTECVSESLADTKMKPDSEKCPSFWSYETACGCPKKG